MKINLDKKNVTILSLIIFSIILLIIFWKPGNNVKEEEKKVVISNKVQNVKGDILMHNPIDNPVFTLYNYSGEKSANVGKFGMVRNGGSRAHQGVDLFALPRTDVYAVLDGKIVDMYVDKKGYGLNIYLEVDNEKMENLKRIDYTINENSGERLFGANYTLTSKVKYIRYAHLSQSDVKIGDKVKAGQVIGKTGVTGNANKTKAPHLHFEVAFDLKGKGLENRVNPIMYFDIKTEKEMTAKEKNEQKQATNIEWLEFKGYENNYSSNSFLDEKDKKKEIVKK